MAKIESQGEPSSPDEICPDLQPPEKPPTAFKLFFRNRQAAIKAENPQATFSEINQVATLAWETLSPEEKEPFKNEAQQEKRKYMTLLAEYKAKLGPDNCDHSPLPPSDEENGSSNQLGDDIDDLDWGEDDQMDGGVSNGGGNSIEPVAVATSRCSRFGCVNTPKNNAEWDNEFCSPECVIKHCRFVFDSYFIARRGS